MNMNHITPAASTHYFNPQQQRLRPSVKKLVQHNASDFADALESFSNPREPHEMDLSLTPVDEEQVSLFASATSEALAANTNIKAAAYDHAEQLSFAFVNDADVSALRTAARQVASEWGYIANAHPFAPAILTINPYNRKRYEQ
jgi:hypothetical protein